jgi:hypothetical protein
MSSHQLETRTLTRDEARAMTDEVKEDAAVLWGKLLRLYEGKAHVALGFKSWGAYYVAEFAAASSTATGCSMQGGSWSSWSLPASAVKATLGGRR